MKMYKTVDGKLQEHDHFEVSGSGECHCDKCAIGSGFTAAPPK